MARKKLPDNFSNRVATFRKDGSVELANGMTLANCSMTDIKIGDYVLDMIPRGGKTTLDVRHKDGRSGRFVHDGSHWYRVETSQPCQRSVDSSERQTIASTTDGLPFAKAIARLLAGAFRFVLRAGGVAWRGFERYPKCRLCGGGALLLLTTFVLAGLVPARNETEAGPETKDGNDILGTRGENETERGPGRPPSNESEAENVGLRQTGSRGRRNAGERIDQLADEAGQLMDEARFKLTAQRLANKLVEWPDEETERQAFDVLQRIENHQLEVLSFARIVEFNIGGLISAEEELVDALVTRPALRRKYVQFMSSSGDMRNEPAFACTEPGGIQRATKGISIAKKKLLMRELTAVDLLFSSYTARLLANLAGAQHRRHIPATEILSSLPITPASLISDQQVAHDTVPVPAVKSWGAAEVRRVQRSLRADAEWLDEQLEPFLPN